MKGQVKLWCQITRISVLRRRKGFHVAEEPVTVAIGLAPPLNDGVCDGAVDFSVGVVSAGQWSEPARKESLPLARAASLGRPAVDFIFYFAPSLPVHHVAPTLVAEKGVGPYTKETRWPAAGARGRVKSRVSVQ